MVVNYNRTPRGKVYFLKVRSLSPHAKVFQFIPFRATGNSAAVVSSPWISRFRRGLQPPHLEQDPAKQNRHKSSSQFQVRRGAENLAVS